MNIDKIKILFGKLSIYGWVLILLMVIGFIFRAYNFHEWLHFGKDQARDALITQAVARGDSSWPLLGAAMGNTSFKIGPIYYYFQIISAKFLGQDPAVLAFPDMLFSILSIPLLYFFLKKYFVRNISISLTALYTISYFSIVYSRFAWNPNPIPFFVLLFMISMHELLLGQERTRWRWVIGVGVSIGVAVQLHAILMVLLPVMLMVISIFNIIKNRKLWKKNAVIFVIVIFLNIPQLMSEFKNNFENTRIFFKTSIDGSSSDNMELMKNLELNLSCHVQANMHMASSLGNKYDCDFISILEHWENKLTNIPNVLLILVSLAFSIFGYKKLFGRHKKNISMEEKYFLYLVSLYVLLFFPLMMPAIDGASHRYFICVFFIPYVFLGFLLQYLASKKKKIEIKTVIVVLTFFAVTNLWAVFSEALQLKNETRGDSGFAVLGQEEQLVDYMISRSGSSRKLYLSGGSSYLPTYAVSMQYLFAKKEIEMFRVKKNSELEQLPLFYIWKNSEDSNIDELDGRKVTEFRNFGQIGIYKLQN